LSATTVLTLEHISKRFGSLLANDNISLQLAEGEVLALLGENGAGKTTLMNILFGHYQADTGTVTAFGRELPAGKPRAAIDAGIGMVHQHFTLADNLTVLENVVLGSQPLWSGKLQLRKALSKLQSLSAEYGLVVDPKARVRDLSVGERQRVEILKTLYRDARVLIMDEPTAVLTPPEVETLFATLRKLVDKGLAIIFISHKLREVMAISNRVTVLRHGKVVMEAETAATSREELAEAMVGRSIPKPKRTPLEPGASLLKFDQVSVFDDENTALLDSAELELKKHEILGIAGVSGNGQAQLADLLCGLLQPDSGTLQFEGRDIDPSPAVMVKHGFGRIVEDRNGTGLIGDLNISENLCSEQYRSQEFTRFGLRRFKRMRQNAERLISDYDVRCQGPGATVRQLSGGNMQKLVLARVLSQQPKVILAHQPTWGLDVGAAAYVHEQLLAARQRGAGVLLISEDLDELLQMCDRIQVLYHGQLSASLPIESVTLQELGLLMSGQKQNAEALCVENA
jgi:simple sugar transport system ATP-binding protein